MGGFLLTLEGPDKSGKTTVVKELGPLLFSRFGIIPVILREPGGTPLGEQIRTILHEMRIDAMDPRTEALLYQASRAELVAKVIRPELEIGSLVMVDRFRDSSKVYQGAGRAFGMEEIDALNDFSTGGLIPNLTILLDVDARTARERSKNEGVEINRMDVQGLRFDETVRKAYRQIVSSDLSGRWRMVDTSNKSIPEVVDEVEGIVEEKLFEVGFLEREMTGKER